LENVGFSLHEEGLEPLQFLNSFFQITVLLLHFFHALLERLNLSLKFNNLLVLSGHLADAATGSAFPVAEAGRGGRFGHPVGGGLENGRRCEFVGHVFKSRALQQLGELFGVTFGR
jgi:hypothetical protein